MNIVHVAAAELSPNIPLFPDDGPVPDVTLSKAEKEWTVKSGDLTAVITENPYTIKFKSPTRLLTEAGPKHQAIFDVPGKWVTQSASYSSCTTQDPLSNPNPDPLPPVVRYINSELNTSPGELIYGLGEQFGPFVKNGNCISICEMMKYSPDVVCKVNL